MMSPSSPPDNLPPSPSTEAASGALSDLDLWSAERITEAILRGQTQAAAVVAAAAETIARAATAAAERLKDGQGRLIYAGAGTSGRLAAQDGVELLPTYGWPAERLMPLLAGGAPAFLRSVEGAEDDALAAVAALEQAVVGPADVIIAVAASGRTPFAVSAIETARKAGALTIGIANTQAGPLLQAAEYPLALVTGAEVVAGSTRMAAGTAQKIALTTLSTTIMVRLGRTYGPYMVHLAASNQKLDQRRIGIVAAIAAVDPAAAAVALRSTEGDVAAACLVAKGMSPEEARSKVAEHSGPFRDLLEGVNLAGRTSV